jgi:hypothetical protein
MISLTITAPPVIAELSRQLAPALPTSQVIVSNAIIEMVSRALSFKSKPRNIIIVKSVNFIFSLIR